VVKRVTVVLRVMRGQSYRVLDMNATCPASLIVPELTYLSS
jgi:hypothetical protein